MLLESVFALLKSVPAIFYAITTGSTITLSGLYMQNRSESERNTQRLHHDAFMRDREREMALRRDVYLNPPKPWPTPRSTWPRLRVRNWRLRNTRPSSRA